MRRILSITALLICLLSGSPLSAGAVEPDSAAVEPDSIHLAQAVHAPVIEAKIKRELPNIYDMPYSTTASYANWRQLAVNTAVLVAGGATTLVILELLPEESTAWSRSQQKRYSMWERYRMHFKQGPVWDKDKFVFNGILHPYGGAAYYMSARSCGFNIWGSFIYSFFISSCFWEYGVECFMEIPSVQDLVVTPVIGSIFGECFYLAKREILARNYRLLGSKVLGYIVAFFLDPVNEAIGYFKGSQRKWCRTHQKPESTGLTMAPTLSPGHFGFSLQFTF